MAAAEGPLERVVQQRLLVREDAVRDDLHVLSSRQAVDRPSTTPPITPANHRGRGN
ncbi:hypothetical protein [Streptomyces griseus]|uniref:hypothetical protein n=1 Tax=Streptomyces griseus TaxID=1911 RepID=UPI0018FE9BE7|nr:hypothetical protein [Streptomyces griseus]